MQYKDCHLVTGLCKQTMLSGLQCSLGIPNIFPLDVMHLINLNDPDLLLDLWCGMIKVYPPDSLDLWNLCVLIGDVWQAHGKTVALATPFILSFFGRAPWNSVEKINSGYKAWEFQIYLISLDPALFQHILPKEYWMNYCKYVLGVHLLQNWVISQDDLQLEHRLLCKFTCKFEQLYYQRCTDRIHFVQQSIHLLTHIASETTCVEPLSCYSQWMIETAIGNLGEEICQDHDPYMNITQWGVLHAQLNLIFAMFPNLDLDNKNSLSCGAKDLEQGYVLLCMCQSVAKPVMDAKTRAILHYWEQSGWPNLHSWPWAVKWWAQLQLSTRQRAHTGWYKSNLTLSLRKTSCVKVWRFLSLWVSRILPWSSI